MTMLPLFGDRQAVPSSPNNGLYFNKFVDQWPNDSRLGEFSGLEGPQKKKWIDKFEGSCGDGEMLKKACDQVASLAHALGGPPAIDYTTTSPFITGMGLSHPVENGFLWHHTLGVPYLPGSSIKGMIRSWARDWLQDDAIDIAQLFGDVSDNGASSAGTIIVFDALPKKPVELMSEVITPHDGGWRIAKAPTSKDSPSDWISPVPIPFLAVRPGVTFQFAMAPRAGAKNSDLKKALNYLREALEWIGAGAKTAVGFGRLLSEERISELKAEAEKQMKEAKIAKAQAEKNAPPNVGQRAMHEEWGIVDVRKIQGEKARVYSIDEAEEVTVELSELRKL